VPRGARKLQRHHRSPKPATWRPRARTSCCRRRQGLHGVDPFKLILVDLELPDGNGMELLAELSQYPATKIVTTLYSDDDHLFPALQCGADGYLLKEDRFEVLVEELQKIVRGQPPLSPAIARRLLTHFRRGTGPDGPGARLGLVATAFSTSRPVPIESRWTMSASHRAKAKCSPT
jgi:two-component system nitrate/nitrite response regulator NarL